MPFANIIIHSTHTHSAPDVSGYWSTLMRGHNRRYTEHVRERVYEAIETALRTRQPAAMRVTTTTDDHDSRLVSRPAGAAAPG